MLPGFKAVTNSQAIVLNAAIQIVFSHLQSTYELVLLKQLASISSGGTPSRGNPKFYDGNIPWAKITDVTASGKWISLTEEYITEEALRSSPAKLFPKGTVFFSKTGTIGKIAITTREIATNQAIFGIVPKSNISSEYLYYCLTNARTDLFAKAKGATLPNITSDDIKAVTVPFPPAEIAKGVVEFLSAIEEGKDISSLNELPGFLNKNKWIVERISQVGANLKKIEELRKEALDQAHKLVISLNSSLAGSRTVFLNEIFILDERKHEVVRGQEYPQAGVKGFGQGLFVKEVLEASKTSYKKLNYLYEGAIVLSQVKAWEGAIAVCGADLAGRYVSPEYRTFRCIPDQAIPEYLAVLFATPWFWNQVKEVTGGLGGRRDRIRPKQFLNLQIPLPTVVQQKKAIPIFERLNKLKCLQVGTSDDLNALLPAILNKTFKGVRSTS